MEDFGRVKLIVQTALERKRRRNNLLKAYVKAHGATGVSTSGCIKFLMRSFDLNKRTAEGTIRELKFCGRIKSKKGVIDKLILADW